MYIAPPNFKEDFFMSKTKPLIFSAVSIALAFVLSFVKIIDMPLGGAVTLCSMLFVCLPGYFYGIKMGLCASVAYGILQFVFGGYMVSIPQVICDYLFAFGALGLSGLFHSKKYGLQIGYLVGIFGRFLFSFLSGVIFFGMYASDYGMSAFVYSILYNGAYIGLEGIITIVLISIPPVNKGLQYIKNLK